MDTPRQVKRSTGPRLSQITATRNANLNLAAAEVRAGGKYVEAANRYGLPTSTVWYHVNKKNGKPGRPISLTNRQEALVADTLSMLAIKGMPENETNLREAIEIVINQMSPAQRMSMQLKTGKISQKYLRCFRRRNSSQLRFARPLRQEASRFRALNGESLTTHYQTVEQMIDELPLSADCIYNLDECGVSPEKEFDRGKRRRCLLPRRGRSGTTDMRLAEWAYKHRVTMMPVVNAMGECGPTLFVFRGSSIPYRNVQRNGSVYTETPAVYLPQNSLLTYRETLAGVDYTNFLAWGHEFVKHVQPKTSTGRKVLLIFDAYRAHISLPVLQLFRRNNIIAYVIPSHTSGKTQSLDLVPFAAFKNELKNQAAESVLLRNNQPFDLFDFCALLKAAFYSAFSVSNVKAGFERAGIVPFNPSKILGDALLSSEEDDATIMTPAELLELLNKKRAEKRAVVFGPPIKILDCGFTDTRYGCVVTRDDCLSQAQKKAEADRVRRCIAERRQAESELRALNLGKKRRAEAVNYHKYRLEKRARLAGVPVEQFSGSLRSISERRAVAKARTATKKLGGN